jgi:hypothetical protein
MCETEQLFWEFAVRTAKSVRALLSVIGRISVVTRQFVRSYRVQQCRGSIGPITRGTHGRTPHRRAPHRRVYHGRTPHRRVPHGCVPHGVYLTGVHLTGVHLMSVHLTGIHLMACTS